MDVRRIVPGIAPRGAAIAAVLAAALTASAALSARQGPPGELVRFQAGGDEVRAYLARPAGDRPAPGVVVLHEWWGLNGQIKGVADRLAREGFLAIVPDLYRGKVADTAELAHELMRALDEDRAVAIVRAAAAYLREEGSAAERPVGTIGFCMGGSLSLSAALAIPEIRAAVIYYGRVKTSAEAVAPLGCPLLGLFGEEDRGIPVEDVRRFESALKEAGKTAEIHLYPSAGHAFFNETRPSYDRSAAADAWERTRTFLRKHLTAPGAATDDSPGRNEAGGE